MPITIRNINKETDIQNFTEFYNLAYVDFPGHKDITADIVEKHVFGVSHFDEKGNFFALEDSRIIGRGRGDIHGNAGSIVISVLPELRNTGIEDPLYEAVMKYLPSKKLKVIWVNILSKSHKDANFYKSKGFQEKKRMYGMERNMSKSVEAPELPDGIIINVPDLEKEHDAVRDTIEIGFSDTEDETTMTEMMVHYDKFTERDYFSPEGILVARDTEGKIIGICIGTVHPAMDDSGFIPWLAVLKEHRGKGIGKALLLSSLKWFKAMENIKKSELSVDLDNPNALKLYKGIGYEVITEAIHFEKKLV